MVMDYAAEQARHDAINLIRLVQRLDKSTSEQDWSGPEPERTFIKALGTLQKVKYAKKLLKNVELNEPDPTPKRLQQLDNLRTTLDRVEIFAKDVEQRTTPKPRRPPPILPQIPRPPPPALNLGHPTNETPQDDDTSSPPPKTETIELNTAALLPADTPAYPSSTSFSFPTPTTLIPPSTSGDTAVTTGAAPRFLPNSSNALHQELSDQLAQMAVQLKRNAMHFSDSLAKDKALVEGTQQKLESNFDTMGKELTHLKGHKGKSGSTTCLVVLIVITVTFLFVLMAYIIRFT